jgi:dynein heavy chain
MHDLMEVNFRVRSREKKIYFSNILKLDTKEYEQLSDLRKVVNVLNEIQEDHNATSDSKLNLVFFNEAVENILKIHRILTMARGNALLIGVSGSGKQSLTKLSSYINSYKVEEIEITKGYNLDSFRNFIKDLMQRCSNNNKSATFLFTDNQIVS